MLSWLSMLLSEAPGEPSIRRAALAFALLLAAAVCLIDVLARDGDTAGTVAIATVTAAFAAATAGRFAEAMDRNGGASGADRTPDAEHPVDKRGGE
jgi:hypothetical protein